MKSLPKHTNGPFQIGDDEQAVSFKRVDLVNASPHQWTETLALAAKIGVTDAMTGRAPRSNGDLMQLLCTAHRKGHMRLLKQAYNAGRFHVDAQKDLVSEIQYATLDRTIEDFKLSARAFHCLCNAEIYFLGDLVSRTKSELLKTKNLGQSTYVEIRTLLKTLGLRFGMDIGQWRRPKSAPWDSPEEWRAWNDKRYQQYRDKQNADAQRRRRGA